MAVIIVNEDEAVKTTRVSRLQKTQDWRDIVTNLANLPVGKALKITLSDDTITTLKKPKQSTDEAKKTLLVSFVQKLRNAYKDKFKIRSLGGDIVILHIHKKVAAK